MKVYFGKKEINIPAKKTGLFGKFFGLMFHSRNSNNLLFEFKTATRISLHSFFVFFPFLVLWLDEKNNVLDYRVCKPFEAIISTAKSFRKIIELPFNRNNIRIIRFFDGKRNI